MAAYDFTADEFAEVWSAFHAHADPETHFLSVADLQGTLSFLGLYEVEEDVTWFIRHVNAVDTGKLSFINDLIVNRLVKGVGDLLDKKGRKKRPSAGRRFTWREIAELFRLFMSIDVDKSGEISFSELYKALRLINPKAKVNDVLSMFSVLDVDKSHAIDFPEFVRGISLGGDATSGPIIAPENTTSPNTMQRSRPEKASTSRISEPTLMSETNELFRNVEGGGYAKDSSSSHFPKRMGAAKPISPGSKYAIPKPFDLEQSMESTPPTSSRPKMDRAPPLSGSRLYNDWANKHSKPPPVLDQRVPVSIVPTRPSFFPNSTSSSSSSPPFSSKPASPSKSNRFPPL